MYIKDTPHQENAKLSTFNGNYYYFHWVGVGVGGRNAIVYYMLGLYL